MRTMRVAVGIALWGMATSGCDGDESGGGSGSCTVDSTDAGVVIACDDGTRTVLPGGGSLPDGGSGTCAVERDARGVAISCSDGTRVTLPASGLDGGTAACDVTQEPNGSIAITCPDGTQATLPGTAPLSSLKIIGATTASCGTCHDSAHARAHFAVMTGFSDAGPVETCGTCHNESSIEPVSASHARLELTPPGLRVQLSNGSVDPTTRRPSVRVTLSEVTDAGAAGAPLTREGMSISMTIAKVETITPVSGGAPVAGPYRSYLYRSATQANTPSFPLDGGTPRMVQQPTAENTMSATAGGTWTMVGPGVYDYTFRNPLPVEPYDPAASHVIAVYATRTVNGVRYVSNDEHFFVPSGGTPMQRDIVRTETCNSCHNPLQAHGGSRQDVQLCLTCHTQGAIDPESGHSMDLNVMVHKIHMGHQLPSVVGGKPYIVIGNQLSVHDYSHAAYPQPIENCQSCHTAMDSDRWVTNGTNEACVSCHENIVDSSKTIEQGGHPFALQAGSTCGNSQCHGPGGAGRDAREGHVTALNTPTQPILDAEILSVTVAGADSAPQVRMRARTGTRAGGAMTPVPALANLSLLEAQVNGPNTGYQLNGNTLVRFPKAMLANLAATEVPGEFTFALPRTLREMVGNLGDPESDSYTLSLRVQYDPTPTGAPDDDRVDMRRNPTAAFGAGEQVLARADIALTEKCNSCHGELAFHGGANLSKNVQQCAMCHTASFDTRVRQGANRQAGPTTSLRLSTMIHRIHGGSIAEAPYNVFGFSAAPPYPVLDFSEIGYPGVARDCLECHATGTYTLPLPENDPPTRTISLDANGNVIE